MEADVFAEYDTYREQPERMDVKYAHVDNVSVFRLLDDIMAQPRNNFVRSFTGFDDIAGWLKQQWAGLFANLLSSRSDERTLSVLSSQLSKLRQVTGALKEYSEAIMRQVTPEQAPKVIAEQQQKLDEARWSRFTDDRGITDLSTITGKSPEELLELLQRSTSASQFFYSVGAYLDGGVYCFPRADRRMEGWTVESASKWFRWIRAHLGLESSGD